MRNEGGGFAASIYEAMPESRIQVTSYQSLIPAFKLFEDTLFRIVIPSAVEGSFLLSGQDHISTVRKRRLGAAYFSFYTSFVYRSARKISRFARNDDTGI